MRVALTGATGLLGANVAAACRAHGHTVIATHRASSRRDHLGKLDLRWVEASLEDGSALTRAFDGADVVVHCAARAEVERRPTPALVAANVDGTQNVIDAVRAASAGRLVHVSSTVAVGVSEDGTPCTEASPFNLNARGLDDGYAVTKRESEIRALAAAADGLDVVVVNPGYLFGPFDARPSTGQMILQVAAGSGVAASPGRNCFVSAVDVARGIVAAAARGRSGERYILGGENWTYREAFSRIAEIVGQPPPRVTLPAALTRLVAWGGDLVKATTGREVPVTTAIVRWANEPGFIFSSAKAEQELGYVHGPPEDGIRAAWSWFQAR